MPPYNPVIAVADQVPDVIVPTVFNDDAVVNDPNEVTLVFTSVPEVGRVTLVRAVVVRVKLFAPDVIKEDPSANVSVADVVGVVIVTLLYVLAATVLLAKITPEIDEDDPVAVNKDPPIPTPPDTTKAPVDTELDPVLCVIETLPATVSLVNVEEPDTAVPFAA